MEQRDEGLKGNEKIEEAIAALQQEATPEMLAHALTVIRKRVRENGQVIVAVEPPTGDGQIRLQAVKAGEGTWFAAFTGFEEELKGRGPGKVHVPDGYGAAVYHGTSGRGDSGCHFKSLEPDLDAG